MHKLVGLLTGTIALGLTGQAWSQTQPAPAPTPAPAATPAPVDVAPAPTPAPVAPVAPAPVVVAPAPPPPVVQNLPPADPVPSNLTAPPGNKVGPAPLDSGPQPVMGKWGTTLYGFAELDVINDSTQSFNEIEGNTAIARFNTYAGDHHRTMFSARNSRIGFKLNAPVVDSIKVSGVVEMDFLGNQPSPISEQALFTNPTLRMRHMALKVETPVVDLLMGQYWQLFGWQSYFIPNTVQIHGVPGEVFGRVPQARISKTLKAGDVAVDIAVAAARPPQRDSAVPDGQAGLRFAYNGYKAVHTMNSTGTAADGLAIGVSGIARRFIVPAFEAAPTSRKGKSGYGLSVDALLPVISGSLDHRENALTLTGSFVTGSGINDQFTSLTGGVGFPALPNPGGATPAPTYASNIDPGLVTFDAQGNLHTINWQSYIVGIQYYLPPSGQLWVSANYSHLHSSNALRYTAAAADAKIYDDTKWWDVNLFFDLTPAARFGAEYAQTKQTFGDGKYAKNERFQFSSFLLF